MMLPHEGVILYSIVLKVSSAVKKATIFLFLLPQTTKRSMNRFKKHMKLTCSDPITAGFLKSHYRHIRLH